MFNKIIICTDLDRTLLPNGNQKESSGARDYFTLLVNQPEVTLVYVSGRSRSLVEDAINEYRLPTPDWVIGDVGTTIYQVEYDQWRHWPDWEADISTDWRGKQSSDLRALFIDLKPLQLQEEAKQNRYKLSYYVDKSTNIPALQVEMAQRLEIANFAASLIYSVDEASEIGLLDVMPARATKFHAIEYLMQANGFDVSTTVFAGDSGNDVPVLASAIPAVLVANATAEVTEHAVKLAKEQKTLAALYLAQGGFLGMNGNYSAGILEGVAHYHPDVGQWLTARISLE